MRALTFAAVWCKRNRKFCVGTDGDLDLQSMKPKGGINHLFLLRILWLIFIIPVSTKTVFSNRLRPEDSGLIQLCAESLPNYIQKIVVPFSSDSRNRRQSNTALVSLTCIYMHNDP
jgi:hypothetical protein